MPPRSARAAGRTRPARRRRTRRSRLAHRVGQAAQREARRPGRRASPNGCRGSSLPGAGGRRDAFAVLVDVGPGRLREEVQRLAQARARRGASSCAEPRRVVARAAARARASRAEPGGAQRHARRRVGAQQQVVQPGVEVVARAQLVVAVAAPGRSRAGRRTPPCRRQRPAVGAELERDRVRRAAAARRSARATARQSARSDGELAFERARPNAPAGSSVPASASARALRRCSAPPSRAGSSRAASALRAGTSATKGSSSCNSSTSRGQLDVQAPRAADSGTGCRRTAISRASDTSRHSSPGAASGAAKKGCAGLDRRDRRRRLRPRSASASSKCRASTAIARPARRRRRRAQPQRLRVLARRSCAGARRHRCGTPPSEKRLQRVLDDEPRARRVGGAGDRRHARFRAAPTPAPTAAAARCRARCGRRSSGEASRRAASSRSRNRLRSSVRRWRSPGRGRSRAIRSNSAGRAAVGKAPSLRPIAQTTR